MVERCVRDLRSFRVDQETSVARKLAASPVHIESFSSTSDRSVCLDFYNKNIPSPRDRFDGSAKFAPAKSNLGIVDSCDILSADIDSEILRSFHARKTSKPSDERHFPQSQGDEVKKAKLNKHDPVRKP